MPVLPDTFVPRAPGGNARDFLGAFAQTSSLMERKQRLQMAQEEHDMERQKFEAFKPVLIAKAQADLTSAAASIANSARIEMLRGKAAAASTDYNDRFLNIMSIPDDKERADTLGAFMGEVAWLDNPALPEYQGFAHAVKEERAKSFTQALTNMKLDQHLEETQAAIQGRIDAAQAAADARKANAATYTGSRERIAQINSDTKLSVADKQAARSSIQLESLQQRANEADQMAADAEHDGNSAAARAHRIAAAQYRDAIQKTTTFAGAAPSAPRDKSQDPKPSPKSDVPHPPMDLSALPNNGVPPGGSTAVAPTKVAKDATVISVGDKQYPIFKDKNGNRAYKIDGHFVPIKTD